MRRERFDAFGQARQRSHGCGGQASAIDRDWTSYGAVWSRAPEAGNSGPRRPGTLFSPRSESMASNNVPPSEGKTTSQVTSDTSILQELGWYEILGAPTDASLEM